MKWENTLLAFDENIINRDFWDWIQSYVSVIKPAHKYEGTLTINDQTINFTGKDVDRDENFTFKINTNNVTDIHHGFDNVFTGWENKIAPWNKPVKIEYKSNGKTKAMYLFANFHHRYGMRTSDNDKLFEKLNALL